MWCTTMDLTVRLPQPHSVQAAFLASPAKRRVIVAGRRGGKTTAAAVAAVEAMLAGRRVLEAAPTADQTSAFWRYCKRWLSPLTHAGLVRKNETERLLEWVGGQPGSIRAKTAHDADGLRGDYADLLILDEFSIMDPDAWAEVGAPMLLDNNGDAVFLFTPQRRNHAHGLYVQAVSDASGRWAAWRFTSLDNPHLSPRALAEITQDMTEDNYKQEVLAEFLENQGAVFRNIAACMMAVVSSTPAEHAGHRLVAGVDWGKQNDFTAISIGCADCHMEMARDRFNQIDYVFQRGRLESLCRAWGVAAILAESNAMGEPIIEELHRAGLPVRGFDTTAASKPPLVENLALALERAEWQFQDDPVWTAELQAYERRVNPATGRSSYSAPAGCHDDTVIARALMLWAATRGVSWLIS